MSYKVRSLSESIIDIMRRAEGTPFAPVKDLLLQGYGWLLDSIYDLQRTVWGDGGLHPLMRIIRFQAGDPIRYFGLRSIDDVRKKFASLTDFGSRPLYGTTSQYTMDKASGLGFMRLQSPRPKGTDVQIVYLHGGGYVMGSAEESAPEGAWFTANLGYECLLPDYPLAPEAPKPTPINTLRAWMDSCVDEQFLIVAESAGGSLALELLEDRETSRRCLAVCLLYPWLDLSLSSDSMQRLGRDYFLTKELLTMFRAAYLGGMERVPTESTPLRITDTFPRVMTIVGEFDPLIDEATVFHDELRKRGKPSSLLVVPGMLHGFLSVRGMLKARERYLSVAANFFSQGVAAAPTAGPSS